MANDADYWAECISIAADECGLELTPEQMAYLADAASGAHEHYGMAFYSPSRIDDASRCGLQLHGCDAWFAAPAIEQAATVQQRSAEHATQ